MEGMVYMVVALYEMCIKMPYGCRRLKRASAVPRARGVAVHVS